MASTHLLFFLQAKLFKIGLRGVSALALIVKIALDQWEGSRAMAGLVCSFCKKLLVRIQGSSQKSTRFTRTH